MRDADQYIAEHANNTVGSERSIAYTTLHACNSLIVGIETRENELDLYTPTRRARFLTQQVQLAHNRFTQSHERLTELDTAVGHRYAHLARYARQMERLAALSPFDEAQRAARTAHRDAMEHLEELEWPPASIAEARAHYAERLRRCA